MRRLSVQTVIELNAPPSKVFDFVADQTNAPRWQKGLHEVRRTTPGPIGVGTEHEFARRFAGMEIVSRNRFTEYQPGRFVAFEIPSGTITGVASYRVDPVGVDTSRLTSTVEFRVAGLAGLAAPLLGLAFRRDFRKNQAALRSILERTGADA